MRWTAERNEEVRSRWNSGETRKTICTAMQLTDGQFMGRRRMLNLQSRGRGGITLKGPHAAIRETRTLFPSTVRDVGPTETVLRPASTYQKKLGARVLKGEWKGMPIYSLTLEERATCPSTCGLFNSCYGNSMPFAVRFRAGPDLGEALSREAAILSHRHRKGFVVRLHILGDFYSPSYVQLWHMLLALYPQVHVFGYSAWKPETEIGAALDETRAAYPDRFVVRTSGTRGPNGTIVVDEFADAGDAIPCPVETGKAKSCGECALCWTAKKTIAFERH